MNRFACAASEHLEEYYFKQGPSPFMRPLLPRFAYLRGKIIPGGSSQSLRSDFSDRLSMPSAASSRNNVFAVHRKGLLMFVMFVMDSDACEGMFGIQTNLSRFI